MLLLYLVITMIYNNGNKKGCIMKISRKYVFPDSNDRSKNDPYTIIDSKKVLRLYK